MGTVVIEHTIGKERQGQYYTVPFEVPPGMEQLTLRYSYPKTTGGAQNVVDLGLTDGAGRFLGWSGGARSEISVGPHSATPGYLMAPLDPGTWHILVGAYKIPAAPLTVRYEICFAPKRARWLAGDLHMHSTASDGQHDIYTLTRMAQKQGLDFIAVSNHNNYSENLHLPVVPGLTLVPAVEWTHYKGHMNFFGVAAPFQNSFVANTEAEMLALTGQAKQAGALVSVNHPKCPFCPYLWQSTTCFNLIEVWNGPMRKANVDAIRWWHGMLAQGRKIPIVGGSDFHRSRSPVRFAHPVTMVYAASPAVGDILAALGDGHSYITSSVGGVRLTLPQNAPLFGSTLPAQGQTLRCRAENGGPGLRLRLVGDKGIVAETARWQNGAAELCAPAAGLRFAYWMVVRRVFGKEYVRAISNPVYFENPNPA